MILRQPEAEIILSKMEESEVHTGILFWYEFYYNISEKRDTLSFHIIIKSQNTWKYLVLVSLKLFIVSKLGF